jgi:hypothetical protein
MRRGQRFFNVLLQNRGVDKERENTVERKVDFWAKRQFAAEERKIPLFLPLSLSHHYLYQYCIAVVVDTWDRNYRGSVHRILAPRSTVVATLRNSLV